MQQKSERQECPLLIRVVPQAKTAGHEFLDYVFKHGWLLRWQKDEAERVCGYLDVGTGTWTADDHVFLTDMIERGILKSYSVVRHCDVARNSRSTSL